MAAPLTPGRTFLVESQPRDDTELRVPGPEQPQQLPQTYRGPRGVTLTDEQDQDEDNWSDSLSESDEPPNEALRKTAEVPHNINLDRLRNRQRQRRSNQAQLADHGYFGEDTKSPGASNFNHQSSSFAGGQAVPYGQNNGYFPPSNPFSSEPFSPPYAANPYPTNSYPTNPYPTNLYPSNYYPQTPYHTNPYLTNPYPTGAHHTNPYGPYTSTTHYPANPYATDPTFIPSQGTHHQLQPEPVMKRPPYSVDSEVEKVKRELKNLKMEESARRHQEKDRRRMEEYWRKKEEQAALEKEAKRSFEKLKRQKDREAKAEQQKTMRAKRVVADEEEVSEVIKRTIEKETREALEKMVAGRQIEGKLRLQEVSREREKERLLMELIDFVDERRRLDGRSWDGGSVRDSFGGIGRSRMELVPREFVVPISAPEPTRSQIEEVVLEVLQRRSLDTEPHTPFSDKQMSSSTWYDERPPLRRLPPRSYVSEPYDADEGLRRPWEWDRRDYGVKGTDSAAQGRSPELLSPRATASDRYAPLESNGSVTSPQGSPTVRHDPTKKTSSRISGPSQSRAPRDGNRPHSSVPGLHDIQEQSSRDAGDEFPFPPNASKEESWNRPTRPRLDGIRQDIASLGSGRTRAKLNAESGRSKRWETTPHLEGEAESPSSESDADEPPPTRSSKHTVYTYTPRKGSSSNRLVLNGPVLPPAPDPPRT